MPSAEYDLRYLEAGLPEMERYLLSKEVYWPLNANPAPGQPPYPRMTLGNLLLAQARLHGRELDAAQREQLARLDEQLDAMRTQWRVAWEQKASAEFQSRLKLWRDFLEDYRSEPENQVDRYAYEVQRRAILQLLQPDAREVSVAQREMLSAADRLLSGVFISGPFIWEPELAAGFPDGTYWYLYGRPRAKS